MAACEFPQTDSTVSGDNLYIYRTCKDAFISWVWDAYDFDKKDWDDGFGWPYSCNQHLPLGRTFNAIWCLEYSSPDPSNQSHDMPILWWGGHYARSHIDELDARCGDGTPFAGTQVGPGDKWTQLYLKFFFSLDVCARASTLVHEARHADATKAHNSAGQDPDWAYKGSYRWQVAWLSWFLNQCTNTSAALKVRARQHANSLLANRFATDPGFRLDAQGWNV